MPIFRREKIYFGREVCRVGRDYRNVAVTSIIAVRFRWLLNVFEKFKNDEQIEKVSFWLKLNDTRYACILLQKVRRTEVEGIL